MFDKIKQYAARLLLAALCTAAGTAQAFEAVTYFHNDISGTPLVATNSGGNVVWKENYVPYGERLNNQAGSVNNKLWFAGKPYDGGSGLSYFGARYYDPVLGRFMGIDPKGFDDDNLQSFNRYAYGNNNPYRFVDPNGRDAVEAVKNWWNASVAGFKSEGAGDAAMRMLSGLPVEAAAIGTIGILKGLGAEAKLVETQGIRFTQDSVGTVFKDGRTVQSLIDGLKSGKISPERLPPIRTFEKDGLTFTLDNPTGAS